MKRPAMTTAKVLMIVVSLLISFEVMAAKSCPDELIANDNLLDLTKFNSELSNEFFVKRINGNAEFDLRREVDLANVSDSQSIYSLNAVGRIYNLSKKNYVGSGFFISPCHVLTVHHNIGPQFIAAEKGQEVGFAYGQNGAERNDFIGAVIGKVVADNPSAEDYAIIAIDSLRNKRNTIFLTPIEGDLSGLTCLTVGYPVSKFQKGSLNKSFGMKTKARYDKNVQYVIANINASPGDSGGALVCLDQRDNKLKSTGLIQSVGLRTPDNSLLLNGPIDVLSLRYILEDIRENDKSLASEIDAAIMSGTCN